MVYNAARGATVNVARTIWRGIRRAGRQIREDYRFPTEPDQII